MGWDARKSRKVESKHKKLSVLRRFAMPTDSQAGACSLSRHSPYCPAPKYALTCASTRRAVFTTVQHGSLQRAKYSLEESNSLSKYLVKYKSECYTEFVRKAFAFSSSLFESFGSFSRIYKITEGGFLWGKIARVM